MGCPRYLVVYFNFYSAGYIGFFLLWEGRKSMARTFPAVYFDIIGKKRITKRRVATEAQEIEATIPTNISTLDENNVQKS
jgi:hypothetical protein